MSDPSQFHSNCLACLLLDPPIELQERFRKEAQKQDDQRIMDILETFMPELVRPGESICKVSASPQGVECCRSLGHKGDHLSEDGVTIQAKSDHRGR